MSEAEQQLRDFIRLHDRGMEANLDAVLEDARKHAREHTQYWYGVRLERLKQMAKERGFWPEMAAIIANGTATASEPPTYAQMLNLEKHRAEKAERSLSALREAVGPFVAVARAVDPVFIRDDNTVWHAGPSAVVTVGDCRKLLAAHDDAQVTQHVPATAWNIPGIDSALERIIDTCECDPLAMCRTCTAGSQLLAARRNGESLSAPTLTLEEVDGAMRKGGVDPATARSVRGILEAKIRVAQKGAGRGDGK